MIEDGWIPIDEYCAKYNERRNTIHARINTGVWERGVHYARPDGSAGFVHEERAKVWLEQKPRSSRTAG